MTQRLRSGCGWRKLLYEELFRHRTDPAATSRLEHALVIWRAVRGDSSRPSPLDGYNAAPAWERSYGVVLRNEWERLIARQRVREDILRVLVAASIHVRSLTAADIPVYAVVAPGFDFGPTLNEFVMQRPLDERSSPRITIAVRNQPGRKLTAPRREIPEKSVWNRVSVWRDAVWELADRPPLSHELVLDISVEPYDPARALRRTWNFPIHRRVAVLPSVRGLLTPIATPPIFLTALAATRDQPMPASTNPPRLRVRGEQLLLEATESAGAPTLLRTLIGTLNGVTVGADLVVRHHGIAVARGWAVWSQRQSDEHLVGMAWIDSEESGVARSALAKPGWDSTAWTIEIRSNAAIAARDFNCTSYWEGRIEMPLNVASFDAAGSPVARGPIIVNPP